MFYQTFPNLDHLKNQIVFFLKNIKTYLKKKEKSFKISQKKKNQKGNPL
jgi:hypothetical protein